MDTPLISVLMSTYNETTKELAGVGGSCPMLPLLIFSRM